MSRDHLSTIELAAALRAITAVSEPDADGTWWTEEEWAALARAAVKIRERLQRRKDYPTCLNTANG